MLTPEVLRRIRRIEFRTRRLVSESFAGAYYSVFKGRGLMFDSIRPYEPGDDVRDIDWNVLARTGEPFVKKYIEERELTVMLMLDASASSLFGTVKRPKVELAAELGAVLAFSAIFNSDKVGLLVFSDRVERYLAPRKGRNHALRLIRELLSAKPAGQGTDIGLALRTVNRMLKRHVIIFLLSDFLVPGSDYERELVSSARRHDITAIILSDPREQSWPKAGLIGVRDIETGDVQWVDTGSTVWHEQFTTRVESFRQMRDATLSRAGVGRIEIPPDGYYVRALSEFFYQRQQRPTRR